MFQLVRNANGQLTETVLYNFTGGSDGGTPIDDDGPLIDSAGNRYGTTYEGGTYNGGTVFKLTHSSSGWEENVLWNFTCGNDGCLPMAGLAFDAAGNFTAPLTKGDLAAQDMARCFSFRPTEAAIGTRRLCMPSQVQVTARGPCLH